jgi:hypothetical protein
MTQQSIQTLELITEGRPAYIATEFVTEPPTTTEDRPEDRPRVRVTLESVATWLGRFIASATRPLAAHPHQQVSMNISGSGRGKLAHPGISSLTVEDERLFSLLVAISDMRNEEESDEYGTLRLSDHAYWSAEAVVRVALSVLRELEEYELLPNPVLSTDSEGGLRATWRRGPQEVRLVVGGSPGRPSYVYQQGLSGYSSNRLSATALTQALVLLLIR